jgi:YHS domain-containing protein
MIPMAWLAFVLATVAAPSVRADSVSDVNTIGGVALHGFDPVAYFTQNKAVLGKPTLTAMHHGVTYQFASQEDQTAFKANPEKYVPQYGGFCAFAASVDVKADADPHEFVVSNGKLYVNNNEKALQKFQEDVAGNITKADHNWPDVAKQQMR